MSFHTSAGTLSLAFTAARSWFIKARMPLAKSALIFPVLLLAVDSLVAVAFSAVVTAHNNWMWITGSPATNRCQFWVDHVQVMTAFLPGGTRAAVIIILFVDPGSRPVSEVVCNVLSLYITVVVD